MANLKLSLSYDGTMYCGFQEQQNAVTVAGHLRNSIEKIEEHKVDIVCAGRTDTGVHAEEQVVNFITSKDMIKEHNWVLAINSKLPMDIRVLSAEYVPDNFSSRFDAKGREYWYHICNSKFISALKTRYYHHYYRPLDVEELNKYAQYLVGEHDFTALCSIQDKSRTKIRRIDFINCERFGDDIIIKIRGSGFLHNMVRVTVGTLIALHNKRAPYERMGEILQGKDRSKAGITMPPNGLVFKKVFY